MRLPAVLSYQPQAINRRTWPQSKGSLLGLHNCLYENRNQAVINLSAWVNCDEYPFNVSMEGGYERYRNHMVSARFILATDNIDFGRTITVKLGQGRGRLRTGDYYIVVPSTLHPKSDVYGK